MSIIKEIKEKHLLYEMVRVALYVVAPKSGMSPDVLQ